MHVDNVIKLSKKNKAFIQHFHLKNIKEFILKKNCMSVNVVKTLGVILHFSQLQQRTHRKKTVYKCEQCSKTFLWHSKVTNHERIYTGEKPIIVNSVG